MIVPAWAALYSWAEGNYDIYVPFMERPLGTDRHQTHKDNAGKILTSRQCEEG